jgi:hypothetical protein
MLQSMNEPILLRIIGVVALVGGITFAIREWRWSGAMVALVGVGFFIRSFLIEQGYFDK